jgi:5-methylcytosine-specific restriction endonuclease McrBC regulatory subunit McrC
MINEDEIVLDDYEQGIEDIIEKFVPVSAEKKAKIDAIIDAHAAKHPESTPVSSEPVTVTLTFDGSTAQRIVNLAKQSHETPSQVIESIVRREMEYA